MSLCSWVCLAKAVWVDAEKSDMKKTFQFLVGQRADSSAPRKKSIHRTAPFSRVPRIARRYAQMVRAGLDQQVHSIVLFGSQARGDARPGSDYDFVVVLDRADLEARDKVSAAGATVLAETDQLCSALVYTPAQWNLVQQSPLGWNIAREGIVL